MASIVADGLDGAFFQGRQAGGLLDGVLGLVMDVTVALGSLRRKFWGAVSRQRSQSMQVAST